MPRALRHVPDAPAASPVVDPRWTPGKLPPSWAGVAFAPPAGHCCARCAGTRFWTAGAGWCCLACHPPGDGSGVRLHDTSEAG